ncbi:MAG: hypothetical protein AB8F26_00935 [Phycisphaerales bacterium]
MHQIAKALLLASLAGVLIGLTACGTIPTREERVKAPQTGKRGPAYKRLVLTFNEAHSLAVKSADFAAVLEMQGADPEQILLAQTLADDSAMFADDVEWFLANRRRMQWHQKHMNELWVRYDEINPEGRGTVLAYTDDEARRVTRLINLKRQVKNNDPLGERKYTYDSDFGDLFYPVGAKQYPGNPWENERER